MSANLKEQEMKNLMTLLAMLKQENQLTYAEATTVAIQINTKQKLEQLEDWLVSKIVGNQFNLTPDELLNKVAQISGT